MENYLNLVSHIIFSMPRGRPVKSQIRQNLVNLLSYLDKAHGYEIYKLYKEFFPKVTMRAVYYNLKKGVETEEFKIVDVEKKEGDYSWGAQTEHTYYSLGKSATPVKDEKIKEYLKTKGYLKD